MDIVMVSGTIRHAVPYTPAGTAIPGGPCDGVLVSTDGATLTVELAEDSGAPITVPLAANMWHPMCCAKITAISGGSVWAGWYKTPQGNLG